MSLPSPAKTRTSIDMFLDTPDVGHPFNAELNQVNELAEEIGAREVLILDEEEQYLISNGLCKWGVQDYLDEIIFANPFGSFSSGWI